MLMPLVLAGSMGLLGLMLVGLAVPLLNGSVQPNPTYGFRTAKTMSDPQTWRRANAFSGKAMVVCGVVMLASIPLYLRLVGSSERISDQAWLGLVFEIVPLVLLGAAHVLYNFFLSPPTVK